MAAFLIANRCEIDLNLPQKARLRTEGAYPDRGVMQLMILEFFGALLEAVVTR
jgi:hypothetical protein